MKKNGNETNASWYFYEKLYFKGRIDDKERIISALLEGGKLPRVYVVSLSDNKDSLFEIYECSNPLIPLLVKEKAYIIAICRGHSNLLEFIRELFDTHQNDIFDFKNYWEKQSFLPKEKLSL
ncbi:MAG: hypothetical protein K6F00_00890 [Lachnospiraceae bacterium]|nr:hypothetical protein [Lachnospiraceae bacterium]